MVTVDELRARLVNEFGFSQEKADLIKGKTTLLETIQECEKASGIDLNFAVVENQTPLHGESSNDVVIDDPEYGSKDWESYVMSKFLPEELYDGKFPTLYGLRRVTSELFEIFSSKISKMEMSFNDRCAYCVYDLEVEINNKVVCFSGAADASPHNMPSDEYSIYPVAIAENRAEARAYRKALQIKVVCVDELKDKNKVHTYSQFESVLTSTGEYNESEPISSQQLAVITAKCKQLGLNKEDYLDKYENPTKQDGLSIINELNNVQQGK